MDRLSSWRVTGPFKAATNGHGCCSTWPPLPTAIFACNDTVAIGAIAAVSECGLTVPGDLSIVGYDNITLSAFSVPPLTTMATPILSIGQRLCQLLLDRNGQLPPPPQVFSASKLLLQARTAPVRVAKGGESS